jgi:hypothetical protein
MRGLFCAARRAAQRGRNPPDLSKVKQQFQIILNEVALSCRNHCQL